MVTTLTKPEQGRALALSGAEVVALVEHFQFRTFLGVLAFLGPSTLAALALLPLRESAGRVDASTPTVWLAVLLVIGCVPAVWRAGALYRALRRRPWLESVPVLAAAALIAYPLRSELYWPACTLLMLVATVAPRRRAFAYVLAVLATNLAAHLVAGDLADTPAVSILGLWIGFFFWVAVACVFTERFAKYFATVNLRRRAMEPPDTPPEAPGEPEPPEPHEPPALTAPGTPEPLAGLTGRQLEVIMLLADGLRYKEVADCLSISGRQVQRHVANAVARAGVQNANQLIALALSSGLVAKP